MIESKDKTTKKINNDDKFAPNQKIETIAVIIPANAKLIQNIVGTKISTITATIAMIKNNIQNSNIVSLSYNLIEFSLSFLLL